MILEYKIINCVSQTECPHKIKGFFIRSVLIVGSYACTQCKYFVQEFDQEDSYKTSTKSFIECNYKPKTLLIRQVEI